MRVERDLIVFARDGVGLATDAFRPATGGPFPVLLERTPYDKSAPSRSERTSAVAAPRSRAGVAEYFVRHGYAVVYQDCRGRYKSGGRVTKYLSEAEDAMTRSPGLCAGAGVMAASVLSAFPMRPIARLHWAASIELFPIGNLFRRGHRLQLDISSSNFPHFDVNPNSFEPEGSMDHPRIAVNRVFVDRKRPSHIVLPVIP